MTMGEEEKLDFEGHRNQAITSGARQKGGQGRAKGPDTLPRKKKVVALQLSAEEDLAFRELGGAGFLKRLLASESLRNEVKRLVDEH